MGYILRRGREIDKRGRHGDVACIKISLGVGDDFQSSKKYPYHTSCRRPETRAAGFSFSVMMAVEQKSLLDLIPGPTGLVMLVNLKALLGCVLDHMRSDDGRRDSQGLAAAHHDKRPNQSASTPLKSS